MTEFSVAVECSGLDNLHARWPLISAHCGSNFQISLNKSQGSCGLSSRRKNHPKGQRGLRVLMLLALNSAGIPCPSNMAKDEDSQRPKRPNNVHGEAEEERLKRGRRNAQPEVNTSLYSPDSARRSILVDTLRLRGCDSSRRPSHLMQDILANEESARRDYLLATPSLLAGATNDSVPTGRRQSETFPVDAALLAPSLLANEASRTWPNLLHLLSQGGGLNQHQSELNHLVPGIRSRALEHEGVNADPTASSSNVMLSSIIARRMLLGNAMVPPATESRVGSAIQEAGRNERIPISAAGSNQVVPEHSRLRDVTLGDLSRVSPSGTRKRILEGGLLSKDTSVCAGEDLSAATKKLRTQDVNSRRIQSLREEAAQFHQTIASRKRSNLAMSLMPPHASLAPANEIYHPLLTTSRAGRGFLGDSLLAHRTQMLTPASGSSTQELLRNAAVLSRLRERENNLIAAASSSVLPSVSESVLARAAMFSQNRMTQNFGVLNSLPSSVHSSPTATMAAATLAQQEGRRILPLHLPTDAVNLSSYQFLARQQMELFEASEEDANTNAQGRNRPILPGQVGIRCRHCARLPPRERKTGAVYYPNKLDGVYQTAQKMTVGHLTKHCTMIPMDIREKLIFFRTHKSSDGGGKRYWAEGVRKLCVIETENEGLKFGDAPSTSPPSSSSTQPTPTSTTSADLVENKREK